MRSEGVHMSVEIYLELSQRVCAETNSPASGTGKGWGGRRAGAGRPPNIIVGQPRRSVSHARRPEHRAALPAHVTLRLALRNLRTQRLFSIIQSCMRAVNRIRGRVFRVVEYSVQSNHIHLIVEAEGGGTLSRGIQSLSVRIAKGINGALRRRGRLFVDRYHARDLDSPRAVKDALGYVLCNFRKHHTWEARQGLHRDPYSSAPHFQDFAQTRAHPPAPVPTEPPATLPSQTWLLTAGWKKHGLISLHHIPSRASRNSRPGP